MKICKKTIWGLLTALVFAAAVPSYAAAAPANAADSSDNIIIVIDPGHGGSNIGGQIPGMDEKDRKSVV